MLSTQRVRGSDAYSTLCFILNFAFILNLSDFILPWFYHKADKILSMDIR